MYTLYRLIPSWIIFLQKLSYNHIVLYSLILFVRHFPTSQKNLNLNVIVEQVLILKMTYKYTRYWVCVHVCTCMYMYMYCYVFICNMQVYAHCILHKGKVIIIWYSTSRRVIKTFVDVYCFSYLSDFTLEKGVVFLLSMSTVGFISDHRMLCYFWFINLLLVYWCFTLSRYITIITVIMDIM